MGKEHLSQMIVARASCAPHAVAFRVRRGDVYVDVRWSEVMPRLEAIAAGLLSAASLDDGGCVSIVGNTSMESCLVDFAALSVGLKTVPVYASLLPEEVGYMHVDTATQLVVVENRGQLDKMRALRNGLTVVGRRYARDALAVRAKVVVIDPSGISAADDWESLETVEARGHARRQQLEAETGGGEKLLPTRGNRLAAAA